MSRTDLAKKLTSARAAAERKRLLAENARLADETLALEIKDHCYDVWTSEPTKMQGAAAALQSLCKFAPGDGTRAYFRWVSGISDLTRGRLEGAIDNLNNAGDIFLALGREHESAQARVATLIALALFGRYTEAVETGEKILKILDKYGNDLAAGKVLMNLGNIVSRRDLHLEAEKYYLSARKRFIRAGEKREQIMAENGLAITYSQLNDFQKAEAVFARALEIAREGKMLLTEAELEAGMGNLALFRGRYDEALKFLELSRRKYSALDMPHQTAVAGLEIADIYRELNLTREAFDIYAEVAEIFSRLKLQGEEARARANFGRSALALGETRTARRELKRSALLYEREKNRTGAAAVKLVQARLELGGDRPAKALTVIEEAEGLLRTSDSGRHKLAAGLLKAETLISSGNPVEASALLSGVLTRAGQQEQPDIALAALNLLGAIARRSRDTESAKTYFKKAVALIERLRAPLAGEEFRMAFLANKLEPFENLAAIYLGKNRLKEAFLYTERSRSRVLAEAVGADGPGITEIPAEFREKLSRLREELNWFYSRLKRVSDQDIASLQNEVKTREKQVADLMRQIESTRKGRGRGADKFIDVAALGHQLGTQRVLVEFVNIDGVFSAFVIGDKKVGYVSGLATSEEVLSLVEGLQFQFGALRYGSTIPEKFAGELKKKADLYLQKLHDKLIRPLEGHLGDRDLVIVPAGSLYYVPFHALNDGEKYLIETREVAYAPSAAVWLSLQAKPPRTLKKALLMAFADESIPMADHEIDALKKIFPAAKSFKGQAATFAAYTKNAPGFDLLHLACHGQFRPENPMFSSLHLADGWITVRDICAQRLNAGLVMLSACETGLNKVFSGEEIIGLARGFLSAGAASLVLSLWTVNDEATVRLMQVFYKNLQRGHSVSASLKIAQNEFIKRGEHPYFWSPFALIGR